MTTAVAQNILKMNTDGFVYSIPQNMKDEFIRLDEAVQNSDFGSEEWLRACYEFNSVFDAYQKG